MVYRAIGLMSGSSLDGLDIVFAEFTEQAGKWTYEIFAADCYEYPGEWIEKLSSATLLSARDYLLLDSEYGDYTGKQVLRFMEEHQLQYKVALVASHGHTSFHVPGSRMTAQLGNGAAIAAAVQLPVISDLRALDIAFGGQGAPIVPAGEKYLWPDYEFCLNIGGIANISHKGERYTAFDICPANRVLNLLANDAGKAFDENGSMAASGSVDTSLLEKLNSLDYYKKPYPKSLSNDFGTDTVYPLIKEKQLSINDALRTVTEHIAIQVGHAINNLAANSVSTRGRCLVTGGGAFNGFLIDCISKQLSAVDLVIPDPDQVKYKEALVMAFLGVLRWRQEYTVMSSVTGATRDSIGGALWMGEEA